MAMIVSRLCPRVGFVGIDVGITITTHERGEKGVDDGTAGRWLLQGHG